jgi:hypothetical protein
MTTVLEAPAVDFERDGWGRPKILQADGKTRKAYTRCTTFVDCIEDKYNLQRWQLRQAAKGFSLRGDLTLAVASTDPEDKKALDRLVDDALDAAQTGAAANKGTALHKLTELIDRGLPLPTGLPNETIADLEAYRAATADLKVLHIEQQTVLDTMQIAGTPDRIVAYEGERYITDLKTGGIEYGTGKIAAQLAVYSRSHLYDVATGARDIHGASTTRGIIVHMRPGSAVCELHWIDLEAGWEYVKDAERVRNRRKAATFKSLCAPFEGKPARPSLNAEKRAEAAADERLEATLHRWIAGCETADLLRELWAEYTGHGWTDAHTDAAKARLAEIELGATTETSPEAQA